MRLNYYANRPKKKGGYRTEVYIAYHLATCALKYIICTAENYPIRENITIRKQFDFFYFFFFDSKLFFIRKNGLTCFVLFYFWHQQRRTLRGERKRYTKNLAKYIGLSRLPGQWLWRKHFGQLFVLQTALEEFVLGQLSIIVLVHFSEYVFGAILSGVGRTIGRTRT